MTAATNKLPRALTVTGVVGASGFITAGVFSAFDTWLLHGLGGWFFAFVVLVLWVARPLDAALRGGFRGWCHAVAGAWFWGVAAHWLCVSRLEERADQLFVLLLVSMLSVALLRLVLAPLLLGCATGYALRRSDRCDRWFATWQAYVGQCAEDPIDSRVGVRRPYFWGAARIMGFVDRALVGGAPRLPAVVRHRVATAVDCSLDELLTLDLDGSRSPGDRFSHEEVAGTIDRVFADWEASLHAMEGRDERASRLELTMASCVRLLLDAEEVAWLRFRRIALALSCRLLPSTDTKLLLEMQREQYHPASMFHSLVQQKSTSLSASRVVDGCIRLILACDLYRAGYGAWSLWLMDVGKTGDRNSALFRAISAFEGALLARAALATSAASEEDRVQWLARGAMHTLAAREA